VTTGRPPRKRRGDLEAALGHVFKDPARLEEALTHASSVRPAPGKGGGGAARRSYQRLEFLGDRVLGLVVAHILLERFPEDAEGALSQRHVALVRREALARVAAGLGLQRWVNAGASENLPGGGVRPAMLADCCEAVIGAIYLDGGLEPARAVVARHWEPLIDTTRAPPRDAKMALQEWAQGRGLERPSYQVVATAGPAHATTFTVEASLAGQEPVTAAGRTKRAAERAAAGLMLERVGAAADG
jgi:ribonuclease III